MKAFKIVILSLFGLSAVLFVGCQSTSVNTVQRSTPLATPQVASSKVLINDKSLDKAVSIVSVNEGVVSGNILQIQALIQNNGSKPVSFNYFIEWYDRNGMMVTSTTSGWRQFRLMGDEVKPIGAIAPNPNVVDFVIKLQEPNFKKN